MYNDSDPVELTDQEKKVLHLMASGMTCDQMAEAMNLKVQTIKWYRMRLRVKFKASTTAALMHKVTGLGLL